MDLFDYKKDAIYEIYKKVIKMHDGGKGSGNFGHAGRKGKVGGSSSTAASTEKRSKEEAMAKKQAENKKNRNKSTGYTTPDTSEIDKKYGITRIDGGSWSAVDTPELRNVIMDRENLKKDYNYGPGAICAPTEPAIKTANYLLFGKPLLNKNNELDGDIETAIPRGEGDYALGVLAAYREYMGSYIDYPTEKMLKKQADKFVRWFYDCGEETHKEKVGQLKMLLDYGKELEQNTDIPSVSKLNELRRLHGAQSAREKHLAHKRRIKS